MKLNRMKETQTIIWFVYRKKL